MKNISPIHRPKPLTASLASFLIVFSILIPMRPSAHAQATRGLGVSPPAQVKQWPGSAKRWALIIGVDKYKDGQISALKGAANDANALAEALVRYAGFPSDQVILMTTGQPEERQPTRVNILRRLSNLASFVPKDGLLLVAFAGHGMERANQAFLLPSDAQISDDVTFLEETAVSVARMKERIRSSGVGQVVLMLDACRNDPGGRADAPNPLTTAYTRAFNFDVRNREVTAFATLYATAIGQRAYEYTEKRQGYFTWAIVEGLKGGAANDHGEVTLAGLLRYVQETVPKRIGIDLGAGKQQRPFAVVEGYRAEELIIAVGAKGATATEAARTESAPSFDPAAMEMSFWESIKSSTDPADFQAYLDKYPDGTFAALARRRAQPARANATASASLPDTGSREPAARAGTLDQAERDYLDRSFDEAIAITRGIVAAEPENARANMLLGLSYLQTGKYANSTAYLSKAVALGEKVNVPIKHHHKMLFDDDLCTGYITLQRDALEFHSTNRGGHDFSVPLSKVYEVAVEALGGGRLHVKVGIAKAKGEDRKVYNFYPLRAGLQKEPGSSLTTVACAGCTAEVQGLAQLVQQIMQLPASSSSSTPSASAPSANSTTTTVSAISAGAAPAVDQIITTSIVASGGKEAMDKVTTRVSKGSLVIAATSQGGATVTASYESYFKAPNKTLSTLNIRGRGTVQEVFDGTIGWYKPLKGGVTKMEGWELEVTKRTTRLGIATDVEQFKSIYSNLTLKGTTRVGDREAYVVEATLAGAKPDLFYFDKETGLLLRMDIPLAKEAGAMEVYYEDYRDVDGLKVAFTTRVVRPTSSATIRYTEVVNNVPVDDALFGKPASR